MMYREMEIQIEKRHRVEWTNKMQDDRYVQLGYQCLDMSMSECMYREKKKQNE